MFDKLSNNLNLLMAKARINSSELARKTGVPASTIKKIRKQHNANPTLTTLIPIAQNFSISVSQLIGDAMELAHAQQSAYLPLLTWQDAARWPEHTGEITTIPNHFNQHTFALSILEDNWFGFLPQSFIIVDTLQKPAHRDYVVVAHENHAPTLRQYLVDDSHIYLKPVVQGFQMSLLTDNHRIIGTVLEQRKHLKQTQL